LLIRVSCCATGEPKLDWLQFTSSLIAALAWPSVAVVLLILLRKQLGSLATRLEELTLPGGAKAKFKEQLESSRDKAEEVALDTSQGQLEKQPGLDDAFLELAKRFPEAAVAQAWKEIEEVLLQIRERLSTTQARSNLNSVVRRLREQHLIDGSAEELFINLRQARNTAVHVSEKASITPGEAVEYRDQVRVLVELFRNVLARLPPKQAR
jgi:hypothetical protein